MVLVKRTGTTRMHRVNIYDDVPCRRLSRTPGDPRSSCTVCPHHTTARMRVGVGQAGRSCLATRTESGELRVAWYLAENGARSKLGLKGRGDVLVRVEVGVYLLLRSNRIKGRLPYHMCASMTRRRRSSKNRTAVVTHKKIYMYIKHTSTIKGHLARECRQGSGEGDTLLAGIVAHKVSFSISV